jgi:aspartyl protease family protein
MRISNPVASLALAFVLAMGAGMPGLQPMAQPKKPDIWLLATTELNAVGNGHFVSEARINGRKVEVVVDTGATTVALSYEDASEVGLSPRSLKYDIPVGTANGQVMAARVRLREVDVGGVRVRDVDGIVLPPGALRGTLLGMSYLSKLRGFSVEEGKLILKN